MGRRRIRYSELTSLLDVLFILIFAALIQAAALVQKERERTAQPAKPKPPKAIKRAPQVTAPSPGFQKLRKRALATLTESLGKRRAIVARVSVAGRLTALEFARPAGAQTIRLDVPLLQNVPDPDVGLVYLGDRNPALRLCTQARVQLGRKNLERELIIIAPAKPLAQLTVALVEGLRRDQERCFADERGVAVLVPAKGAPTK